MTKIKCKVWLVLLLAIVSAPLNAIQRADESDSDRLEKELIGFSSSNIVLTAAGLVPGPLGTPAEVAQLANDIILKNYPAALYPPDDFGEFIGADECRFELASINTGFGDFTESTSSMHFIKYDRLLNQFSDLGLPKVFHPDADVQVTVRNPYLNTDTPALPEGRHEFTWTAETSMNWIMDVGVPAALIPTFVLAESALAKKLKAGEIAKFSKKGGTELTEKSIKSIATATKKKADLIIYFVGLASELGLVSADVTNAAEAFEWYEKTSVVTAVNSGSQWVTVWDEHPPYFMDVATQSRVENQNITLEATDFGGVRLGRVIEQLQSKFDPTDDCNRQLVTRLLERPELLLKIDETTPIHWETSDAGPYPNNTQLSGNQVQLGEDVITTLIQNVTVEDTQAPLLLPPAGFARESLIPIDLSIQALPLGKPQVVDLADPRPTFSHTAPDVLDLDRRYAIVWQAQDASGNKTVATQGNPDQFTQFVTIKTPGTNTAPAAEAKSAATKTAQAVEITLTGVDGDVIDGRADPLVFIIDDYPINGQFEAPLLPFFIEDFRLSPIGDHETIEDNEIVRTSPLKHLADAFRLLAPSQHGSFLKREICDSEDNLSVETFRESIPVDFIYKPTYVHVDDDGFYYVRDHFWRCASGALSPIPRISKWDADGKLIKMRDIYTNFKTAASRSDFGYITFIFDDYAVDEEFSIDSAGWIWFSAVVQDTTIDGRFVRNDIQTTRLYGMNKNLDFLDKYGELTNESRLFSREDRFQDMSVDLVNEVFYELRGFGFRVKELDDNYTTNRNIELNGYLEGAETLSTADTNVFRSTTSRFVNVPMTTRKGFTSLPGQCYMDTSWRTYLGRQCPLATDIEVDSEGYVYIAQRDLNRILKYEPAYQDDSGVWQIGEFIGWTGDCSHNKQNELGVFYNACDESLGVSRGFQCTDKKCGQIHNQQNAADADVIFPNLTGGDQPGMFKSPSSIKVGPRDILYVADTGNSRIQRFGADGIFSGEARSTGTGINQGEDPGFMLGNFGKPYSLSVNSSAFYVINRDDENGDNFLHVFKTLPFYDVTDNSAMIKYVSDFNYQGDDVFTYIVDDGIASSSPAAVSVNVTRSFRPPEQLKAQCFSDFTTIESLTTPVPCTLDEDSNIVVRINAKDRDGFLSTGDGGLDTHDFSIVNEPGNGQLTLLTSTDNAAVYRYTPGKDYNGDDSFTFTAFDGVHTAAQDGAARFKIIPQPDPVVIELPENIKAARGFSRMISADFSDVDVNHQPGLIYINWGDGVFSRGEAWGNSGHYDDDGNEVSPQSDFSLGKGMLLGSHNYSNSRNYALEIHMLNHAEDGGQMEPTIARSNVEVIEATVVSSALVQPVSSIAPDEQFDIHLIVTNQKPDGWAGLIARDVEASIDIPEGLTLVSSDTKCTGTNPVVCDLGDLTQGESKQIKLVAKIDLAAARENSSYILETSLTDAGPKAEDVHKSIANITIKDQDGDGYINVDDAFPTDERYGEDNDGDRIADEWELAHGLDSENAADALLDSDGDGRNNLEEFQNDSYPLLAEAVHKGEMLSLEQEGNHRLGFRVAAGDINGDGFSDVVATVPGYEGQGGFVIYYGSPEGVNAFGPVKVAATTELGRAVAVGDVNDDGYADIAVASNHNVYLYLGAEDGLLEPKVIPQPQGGTDKFGNALLIQDLDNDQLPDLIIASSDDSVGDYVLSGAVYVYRAAAQYWKQSQSIDPDMVIAIDDHAIKLGDSLAVADIDGDTLPDLMVGAAFVNEGLVFGYLGKNIVWNNSEHLTFDYVLRGETNGDRFGYSLASGVDVDGDGRAELLVGSYANNGSGAAYLYYSQNQFWDPSVLSVFDKASSELAGDQFGVSVLMTEPTTYTGANVIIIGSNRAERDVLSPDEGSVAYFSPSNLETNWFSDFGMSQDMLAYSLANASDINGDGENDIVAGAPDISTGDHVGHGGHVRIYYGSKTGAQDDSDSDGVADKLDNCPSDANTDQADKDNDGLGDVCDDVDDRDDNTEDLGTGISPAPAGGNNNAGGGGSFGLLLPLLFVLCLICFSFPRSREGMLRR